MWTSWVERIGMGRSIHIHDRRWEGLRTAWKRNFSSYKSSKKKQRMYDFEINENWSLIIREYLPNPCTFSRFWFHICQNVFGQHHALLGLHPHVSNWYCRTLNRIWNFEWISYFPSRSAPDLLSHLEHNFSIPDNLLATCKWFSYDSQRGNETFTGLTGSSQTDRPIELLGESLPFDEGIEWEFIITSLKEKHIKFHAC